MSHISTNFYDIIGNLERHFCSVGKTFCSVHGARGGAMPTSKFWKCDLQVGTPGWSFKQPPGSNFNFEKDDDRRAYADLYMQAAIKSGVEVLALAAHNTHEWIDVLKDAGKRHGIYVFPGVEITTGSGSDGVHLLIIGALSKTERDFDLLLSSELGFDAKTPRFAPGNGNLVPASSKKTILEIFECLPPDYLVIAPHAFNDNGIASGRTVKGDRRWSAINHPRLAAIDVGESKSAKEGSFNRQFRDRSLTDYPRLPDIAFVETSDAYCMEDIGKRFTWIRMAEPSLEALRQAFLDHEARIIRKSDSRLEHYGEANPNNRRHAWIQSVTLGGELVNSRAPLTLDFHPGLNVIIGSRGSGKSTVVAGIRQLYSSTESLPQKVKDEAESFIRNVFVKSHLSGTHIEATSQQPTKSEWSLDSGSTTRFRDQNVRTEFPVRVVSQKELFERVSFDREDPFSASRSFLGFVDESLGLLRLSENVIGSWWEQFEEARRKWIELTLELTSLGQRLQQTTSIQARIVKLEEQIRAIDLPEAGAARKIYEARQSERERLEHSLQRISDWLQSISESSTDATSLLLTESDSGDWNWEEVELETEHPDVESLRSALHKIVSDSSSAIQKIISDGQSSLGTWRKQWDSTTWWQSWTEANELLERYSLQLKERGIDPESYGSIKKQLDEQKRLLSEVGELKKREEHCSGQLAEVKKELNELIHERKESRKNLLEQVQLRSKRLRFEIVMHADSIGWIRSVRELLGLRNDWFVEDVEKIGKWLCEGPDEDGRIDRFRVWQNGLLTGEFSELCQRVELRKEWLKKLQGLDATIRARLGSELVDDIVKISFLKQGCSGGESSHWQDISEGSAGQRTAAMVAFVLHHGDEPLVFDQPEDDLDTELISDLIVRELRESRWKRQLIVITHNANIPVNGDSDHIIVLENRNDCIQIRTSEENGKRMLHSGPIEVLPVRQDVQAIMEGGINAFISREQKYRKEILEAQSRDGLPIGGLQRSSLASVADEVNVFSSELVDSDNPDLIDFSIPAGPELEFEESEDSEGDCDDESSQEDPFDDEDWEVEDEKTTMQSSEPVILPDLGLVAIGDGLRHNKFGPGKVTRILHGKTPLLQMEFEAAGSRMLDPRFAKLQRI